MRLWIALCLVLGLAGLPAAQAADCPGDGGETVVGAVAVSPNTVQLADGTVIRLAGVVPAEAVLDGDGPSPWAEAGRALLADLIGQGSIRLAWIADTPDRHGRRAARVVLTDGRWLEAAMVERGLLRAQWLPGEEACFAALLPFEAMARTGAAGAWSDPAHAVVGADDPSLLSRNGLYELVEGRVVSVGHGNRMVFLDFGPDVRHDFTVMVPLGVSDAMAGVGIEVDSLAGRRVRVRGIIEDSGGPAIRLNDRLEIELID